MAQMLLWFHCRHVDRRIATMWQMTSLDLWQLAYCISLKLEHIEEFYFLAF